MITRELNKIPKKSFIFDNHQIDLLLSSKHGLYFEITNNIDNKTTRIYLKTKIIRKIGKLIYNRLMLIDKDATKIELIKGHIPMVHHVNKEKYKTNRGIIAVSLYKNSIIISLYMRKGRKDNCCQRIELSNDFVII